jgi:predicted nucleic acid-binding protein
MSAPVPPVNGLGNSIAATDRLVSRIETFFTLLPDAVDALRFWRRLIEHEVRGAKVHDAQLAALMQANGIRDILTYDAADFRRYRNIFVIDPASLTP